MRWFNPARACAGAVLLAAVAGIPFESVVRAQTSTAPPPAAPTSGFRAEFLKQLTYFEQRIITLAEAIPAEKYTWAPGEGVRSVSQVFLHIAQRNFTQPALVGTPPPPDLTARDLGFTIGRAEAERGDVGAYVRQLTGEGIVEVSTADKPKVIATLRQSFQHFREAVLRMKDADADKPVSWIGDNTYRGVCFFWTRHLGEHLGQAIAYARVNGIVPPWTAAQQMRRP